MQTGPLPKHAYQKWNGGQNTDAKQCQTCTTPLVLIELVGDQKADADTESGSGTSN